MKKLFCINTITNFKEIIYDPFGVPFMKKYPDIEIYNILDDTLLKEVTLNDGVTSSVIRRMYNYSMSAVEYGADCIMCTCTSLNTAANALKDIIPVPIFDIDEPVARQAVQTGKRIGVLATLPTSPKAIIKTINAEAAKAGKSVEVITKIAEGAFDVLSAGDRNKHDEMVCQQLYALAHEVDVIAFAQISIGLLKHDTCSVPILKIGESGYEYARKLMGI